MPYNPSHDLVTDPQELAGFVAEHPLAGLVTHDGSAPDLDLVPLLLVPSEQSATGFSLIGHVARANPLWHRDPQTVLASFGPAEHYVSPTWYPSKAEHHRVVPTWNYLVVNAWGPLVVHDDARWVRGVVARLTKEMEAGRENPWRMSQAPADFVDTALGMVVGIEIPVERMEGRFKVSGARPVADRLGAADGIEEDGRGRAWPELVARMRSLDQPAGPSRS